MSSLDAFRIEFDRANATYYPGEVVSGKVVVSLRKQKNVRALKFTAKGDACASWSARGTRNHKHRGRAHRRRVHHREVYFNTTQILLGGEGDARVEIPPGYHAYPFSCQLPFDIPSSFEHVYGHIRYTMKATIDRPWKFDHECKAAFTVVSVLDLNARSSECSTLRDEFRKKFYSCCCINNGMLSGTIRIPTTGYVPGQPIVAAVNFSNTASGIAVTGIAMTLEQSLKFHGSHSRHHETKTVVQELSKSKAGGPFDQQGGVALQFLTPPIPPSGLDNCKIIDMHYQLKISVHVSGLHRKVTKLYPILIGTIPLRVAPTAPPDTEIYGLPEPVPVSMPMHDPGPTGGFRVSVQPYPPGFTVVDGSSSSVDTKMPPPSYEECMARTSTIRDDDESSYVYGADQPFAPRYPVFSFPSPDASQ